MPESVGPPLLPDYDFDRELGRGGMGTVYLYRHAITQRPEVVKLLSPEVLAKPGNRGRFEREIRAAFKLAHPNVVAAYSTHRVGDALAFCMEYVDGDDLMRVVQRDGPLPAGEACGYIVQACHGLQHAFERGMVHRDIKPGNLMRTAVHGRTVVKVVDFGLAKLGGDHDPSSESGLTQYGQVLGTPDFIAPEQIRNTSGADIRSDLYSLGCTLYFLLAGRPPFKGESLFDLFEMHIHADAPPLDHVREGLPPGLAAVVARMMAKDPADRPQTPAEAADALLSFADFGTQATPALDPHPPSTSHTATTAGRNASATPPQPAGRRPGTDVYESLSVAPPEPPASTRYQPVRPESPPKSRLGWLVPLVVGGVILAGIVAVVLSLNGGPRPPVPAEKPSFPSPTSSPASPAVGSATTEKRTAPTASVTPTKPTLVTPPTPPRPSVPEWFTSLFGDPATGPKQTVWPEGDGWKLADGAVSAPDAATERVALFDGPRLGDFDLTAELVVTGGAGLMVRGDRRAVDGQPTGYLIGLGQSAGDTIAFDCGAVHRWGLRDGRSKKLADGVSAWATPGRPLVVAVEVRGDRLSVRLGDHPPVQVRDSDGYAGGHFGLVTQPGGSVVVRSLVVRPGAEPHGTPAELPPGFASLVTPDRLTGWEVEGEERSWEMVGGVLTGRQEPESFNTKGHLLTATTHNNFLLQFDFLLRPGATALVSLRADNGELADVTLNGMKTRLPTHPWLRLTTGNDDTRPRPGSLERWFGSRSVQPPVRGQSVLNPLTADAWHEAEVRVDGNTITVKLDGQAVEYPRSKADPKLNDPGFVAGQERTGGRIGVCPFAGEVQLRNIRVKELGVPNR